MNYFGDKLEYGILKPQNMNNIYHAKISKINR